MGARARFPITWGGEIAAGAEPYTLERTIAPSALVIQPQAGVNIDALSWVALELAPLHALDRLCGRRTSHMANTRHSNRLWSRSRRHLPPRGDLHEQRAVRERTRNAPCRSRRRLCRPRHRIC